MGDTSASTPSGGTDEASPRVATGPSKQVLSGRGVDSLREEAINDDGTAREWRTATKYFEEYVMKQFAASNTWAREKGVRPQSHRFTPQYAKRQTGKIYGGLRHVDANTPPFLPLQTVLVTRVGWPYDVAGQPAPPVDFLSGLSKGRKKAHGKLRRILNGHNDVRSWGRATVVEPHTGRRSGYPHAHDGLAVVGDIDTEELRPVIDAYVAGNPFARQCDHGKKSLRVRKITEDSGVETLAAELTNNLVGYEFEPIGDSPLEGVSNPIRRFATLMWATGKRTVSFGETFREWVARSQAEWSHDGDSDDDAVDADPPVPADAEPIQFVDPDAVDLAYEYPDGGDWG